MTDDALPPECPYCQFFVTYPTDQLGDYGITWICVRCRRHFLQVLGVVPQVIIMFPEDTYQPGE